jgi:hypothetical protein
MTGLGGNRTAVWVLGALLATAFAVRLAGLDQPLVENYVGRQVPTAMVARNLQRGSGFLHPSLDVAPFPNRFLVEPPGYAWVAGALSRWTRLDLGAAGRATSAFGIVLAAWGLYGLAARREGDAVALAAVAVFLALPITLRYGRAFQPDALMLGLIVAGLRCCDDAEHGAGRGRLAAGPALLAAGLALKVVSVYVLVPLLWCVRPRRDARSLALAAATLAPAVLWYAFALAEMASSGGGSRASADNGGIWLSVLVPTAWLDASTYRHIGRFLFLRSFTPLGPPLAVAGLVLIRPRGDRLWTVWGLSALAAMAALAAKLHHEYYWLALAPVLAVGVARAVVGLARAGATGRLMAGGLSAGLVGLSALCAGSTWTTPAEWRPLRAAARDVRQTVPAGAWLVAPEALLFEADRRGCRLELTPSASRRAAGEWGGELGGGPVELLEFYRRRGASYFADVAPDDPGPDRLALHAAVRRRYNVVIDRPGVLIARLTADASVFAHETEGPDSWPPQPPARPATTTGQSPFPTSTAGNRAAGRSAF